MRGGRVQGTERGGARDRQGVRSSDWDGTMWRGRFCDIDEKARSRVHDSASASGDTEREEVPSENTDIRECAARRRPLRERRPRRRRHYHAWARRRGGHRLRRLRFVRKRRSALVFAPLEVGAARDRGRRDKERSGGCVLRGMF
jgi:hypothetical protein